MNYEEALLAMLQGKLVKEVAHTQGYYYMYDKETKSFERMTPSGARSWDFSIPDISNFTFELYTLPVYEYQYLFRFKGRNDAFEITSHTTNVYENTGEFEYEVIPSSKRQVCV